MSATCARELGESPARRAGKGTAAASRVGAAGRGVASASGPTNCDRYEMACSALSRGDPAAALHALRSLCVGQLAQPRYHWVRALEQLAQAEALLVARGSAALAPASAALAQGRIQLRAAAATADIGPWAPAMTLQPALLDARMHHLRILRLALAQSNATGASDAVCAGCQLSAQLRELGARCRAFRRWLVAGAARKADEVELVRWARQLEGASAWLPHTCTAGAAGNAAVLDAWTASPLRLPRSFFSHAPPPRLTLHVAALYTDAANREVATPLPLAPAQPSACREAHAPPRLAAGAALVIRMRAIVVGRHVHAVELSTHIPGRSPTEPPSTRTLRAALRRGRASRRLVLVFPGAARAPTRTRHVVSVRATMLDRAGEPVGDDASGSFKFDVAQSTTCVT